MIIMIGVGAAGMIVSSFVTWAAKDWTTAHDAIKEHAMRITSVEQRETDDERRFEAHQVSMESKMDNFNMNLVKLMTRFNVEPVPSTRPKPQ